MYSVCFWMQHRMCKLMCGCEALFLIRVKRRNTNNSLSPINQASCVHATSIFVRFAEIFISYHFEAKHTQGNTWLKEVDWI